MNQLPPIEQNGQRVLTTQQLAEAFGTDANSLTVNFNRNKDRYKEGKHYFELRGEELRALKASLQNDMNLKFAPVIHVWTEKGAWLHAKSLNTDEAWEAYETLVDDYYEKKQQSLDVSRLSPEMQMFKHLFDGVAKIQLDHQETQKQLAQVNEKVEVMQETFLQRDEDWRKSINTMLNSAAYRMGGNYQDLRAESYRELEERAHCKLTTRLKNLVERLEDAGATKTQLKNTNRMTVIESDPKLKEIYTSVVKELNIGSMKVIS